MTTVHPPSALPLLGAASGEVPPELVTGARLRRLEQRRRLLREQLLAVLVLLIALAVTVAVLAMQWLESGPANTTQAAPAKAGVVLPGPVVVNLHSGGFPLTHSAGMLR